MDRDVALTILESLTNITESVQSISIGSGNTALLGARGDFSSGDNDTRSVNDESEVIPEEPVTKTATRKK